GPIQKFQSEDKIARRAKPHLSRLFKTVAHQTLESDGQLPRRIIEAGRFFLEDCHHTFGRSRAAESPPSDDHFVQHTTQREYIAAWRDLLAAYLLRRHIRSSAQNRTCLRPAIGGFIAITDWLKSRQAKIQNLHSAIIGQKNILGFKIAVNDSLRVSCIDTFSD